MPSPTNAGALIGQRLGKYDILALLALGGTAEIYLARIGGEAGFQKYVVVKCLLDHLADDAEFVRMFLDEARLGAQLHHSNIVQTLELGEHEGRYYLVMEFLAGMSLAQLARKAQERVPGGLIPTHLVLALAAQACGGLHYAHQRTAPDGGPLNIVHRDVSPQNLVVSFDGVLKIVDFGIAKAELRQTHTRSGTIKGKFAYMSPEQCQAEPIDRRTDIFALGTILHEVLTARRLFKRASTYDTYQAIVKGDVPPPSQLNPTILPEVDRVVMKALAYRREERYETAEAMGEALLGVLHGHGTSVSTGDLARMFDLHFAPELEEHGQRMRDLIAGGPVTRSIELSWDADDGEADAGGGRRAASDFGDDGDDAPAPTLLPRGRAAGGDEFGGETEIELDPGQRIAGIHHDGPAARAPDESTVIGLAAGPAGDELGTPPAASPIDDSSETATIDPHRRSGGGRRIASAEAYDETLALGAEANATGVLTTARPSPHAVLSADDVTPHPLDVYDTPAPRRLADLASPPLEEGLETVLAPLQAPVPRPAPAFALPPTGAPLGDPPTLVTGAPPWQFAIVFVLSAAAGLGLTLLLI